MSDKSTLDPAHHTMKAQIKGPGAGTLRARSYHSRFNQRLIVKTRNLNRQLAESAMRDSATARAQYE